MIGRSVFEKIVTFFWGAWESKRFIVNLLVSILPITLYYFNYMPNIRENTGSFIAYAVGILTVDGVFLTLLVTLKSSPVMDRLKNMFPKLHNFLYEELRKQIASCIYFILINLAIAVAGPISNKFVIVMGIISWSYYMVSITLGALFSLKAVMNLATSEVEKRKRMS
ncbi:hypothetical protein AMR94_23180 [Bacillus sp. G3(2015)]|uniref:hypothetical protein n=1 Tax=Bacillus sp. G3(2015) TaxID=1706731 RepID=UPI000738B0A4|nr:hypothetical protein [Bacillus sp. G3(2015)]KUF27511.1 hypothetical protein AMR94_23180 [Bacillus sp. G3(2015)]